jgi:class 3 adenylate cyclase
MALKDELETQVSATFNSIWTTRDGTVVPDADSVKLTNDGVHLNAVVLYADLADSTELVQQQSEEFSAETYKAFLYCAAKIIRSQNGIITAYDGDRIMAVFLGERMNSRAVKAAMKIYWAVENVIKPKQAAQYPNNTFSVKHGIGVDSSKLLVANAGVRGAKDLVWVGNAANVAAKLATIRESPYSTFISKAVYDTISSDLKTNGTQNYWEARSWKGKSVYRSNWMWHVDR